MLDFARVHCDPATMSYCFWPTCVQAGTPPDSSHVLSCRLADILSGEVAVTAAGGWLVNLLFFCCPRKCRAARSCPLPPPLPSPHTQWLLAFPRGAGACVGWLRPVPAGSSFFQPLQGPTAQHSPAPQPRVRLPKRREERAKPPAEQRSEEKRARDGRGKSKEGQAAPSSARDWSRSALPPVESPCRGRGEREGEGADGETGMCCA